MYKKYGKRLLDILCASVALIAFCWLYALIALLVRIKLGRPVLFKQERPGLIDRHTGKERIFTLYKFRTMTNERDESGKLLPDGQRLTGFGKWLRATSLDELPEALNILKGDMSVIGPRPQLVRDMVFMTAEQRRRHTVRPGLSGLAQINGRNGIEWEEKLQYDLQYIKKVSFVEDIKIVLCTVKKVLKTESISYEGMATAEDFGDHLLRTGKVSKLEYDEKQNAASILLDS
ncbi:MAG: sugar transferase [Eubacteriales bacterium]|nr:sugar transferase [Eubacteriales bacterium]